MADDLREFKMPSAVTDRRYIDLSDAIPQKGFNHLCFKTPSPKWPDLAPLTPLPFSSKCAIGF